MIRFIYSITNENGRQIGQGELKSSDIETAIELLSERKSQEHQNGTVPWCRLYDPKAQNETFVFVDGSTQTHKLRKLLETGK